MKLHCVNITQMRRYIVTKSATELLRAYSDIINEAPPQAPMPMGQPDQTSMQGQQPTPAQQQQQAQTAQQQARMNLKAADDRIKAAQEGLKAAQKELTDAQAAKRLAQQSMSKT